MLDFLNELWNSFSGALLSILPTSPFTAFLNQIGTIPYLAELNWFLPIGDFIRIGTAYLGVVALFYLYMIAARWLKVIGD